MVLGKFAVSDIGHGRFPVPHLGTLPGALVDFQLRVSESLCQGPFSHPDPNASCRLHCKSLLPTRRQTRCAKERRHQPVALGSWQMSNPAPFPLLWGHSEPCALHGSPELAHGIKLPVELTSMVSGLSADPLGCLPIPASLPHFPTHVSPSFSVNHFLSPLPNCKQTFNNPQQPKTGTVLFYYV